MKVFSLCFLCLSVLVVGHLAHVRLERSSIRGTAAEPPLLPNATGLRLVSSGYESASADLFWLQTVQYVGDRSNYRAGWPHLYQFVDFVTDLDPRFGYAYQVGGTLLALRDRYDQSTRLLEKGMSRVPDRWQLPFFAAYNYLSTGDDVIEAARLLERAASMEGSPSYLPLLVARLYSSADQLDTAARFIDSALQDAAPGTARDQLELRAREILVERDLRTLENAIVRFKEERGRLPSDLKELGSQLPPDFPSAGGAVYEFDPTRGRVSSPELPRRLRLDSKKAGN